jgi:hypothetical protein
VKLMKLLKEKLGISDEVLQKAKKVRAHYQENIKNIEKQIATLDGDTIWFTIEQEKKGDNHVD